MEPHKFEEFSVENNPALNVTEKFEMIFEKCLEDILPYTGDLVQCCRRVTSHMIPLTSAFRHSIDFDSINKDVVQQISKKEMKRKKKLSSKDNFMDILLAAEHVFLEEELTDNTSNISKQSRISLVDQWLMYTEDNSISAFAGCGSLVNCDTEQCKAIADATYAQYQAERCYEVYREALNDCAMSDTKCLLSYHTLRKRCHNFAKEAYQKSIYIENLIN
eukprot:TRINITY_DN5609_c0_g1_i1.p1 TRINITY_DN5609_c0_g1~~TRINITY_DN5609_c0_g1_i1.p1  ORF type:complete len:219 (+),score=34.68 TRINITY_DN5609_c0_g1_i1:56-712(+)